MRVTCASAAAPSGQILLASREVTSFAPMRVMLAGKGAFRGMSFVSRYQRERRRVRRAGPEAEPRPLGSWRRRPRRALTPAPDLPPVAPAAPAAPWAVPRTAAPMPMAAWTASHSHSQPSYSNEYVANGLPPPKPSACSPKYEHWRARARSWCFVTGGTSRLVQEGRYISLGYPNWS